ncbi:MAG: PcfJ domain-containing protein [Lachnospiraceae bacterium]|nr:PcfJ domain-containing protein [Lachnospiraceae bacterium]
MKGAKALRSLPYEKVVRITKTPENTNGWYCCSVDNYAYTANIVSEMLTVCVYGAKVQDRKRKPMLPIIERHFVLSSGETLSERFDEEFNSKPGTFTITMSVVETWESSWMASHLTYEWNKEKYVPLENADEIILGFARKNKLDKRMERTYTSGLCWLANLQALNKQEKAERAAERREERIIQRMRQVPEAPKEFERWVSEERFSTAAWFYKFKKREAHGVCGSCNKQSVIPGVKSGKHGVCPHCGRPIQYISVKNADRYCRYWFNVTYIEQLSENEFVNRYFSVTKSYGSRENEAYCNVSTHEFGREFFTVKGREFATTDQYKLDICYGTERWKRIQPRYRVAETGRKYPGNIIEITQALAELLGERKLKNMDLRPLFENNDEHYPARIFGMAFEYPVLESIAKMGLYQLAWDIISQGNAIGAIFAPRSSGSPAKLLGVDKPTLAKFAEIDISLTQYLSWKSCGFTINNFEDFKTMIEKNYPLEGISSIIHNYNSVKFGTLIRYLEKQRNKFCLSEHNAVFFFRDYLEMAQQCGIDLGDRSLLYPENIRREHDRIMAMLKDFQNRDLSEKLTVRGEILKNLAFSDDEFMIVPLCEKKEFLNESNVLSHCVKTYAERCANGETNIFGLRKTDAPDTPYFTVNIDNYGKLIQNHGKRNCDPPKEVKKFVNKWLKFVEKKLKTLSLSPAATAIKLQIGA